MTGTAKELITSDLDREAIQEIEGELKRLLADTFALYLKTKGFHWHVRGRHFRDYHLLLDEQAAQLFDITDEIAERGGSWGPELCARSAISASTNGWRTAPAT